MSAARSRFGEQKLHHLPSATAELTAALKQHQDVVDALVIYRNEPPFEDATIAYVVPSATTGTRTDNGIHVAQWGAVWNGVYRRSLPAPQPDLNTAGWFNSYSGRPMAASRVRAWARETANRILRFKPRHVLEIGCGSGLILSRVAPHCESYHAIDVSEIAIDYVMRILRPLLPGGVHITANTLDASALDKVDGGPFDTVILNSVIQYLPNAASLVNVLNKAVDAATPDGTVFVGDVLDRRLRRVHFTTIELTRVARTMPVQRLFELVRFRESLESELTVEPAFFHEWANSRPDVKASQLLHKRGPMHDEVTRFRYDAVLSKREPSHDDAAIVLRWDQVGSLARLGPILASNREQRTVLRGVPDSRLLASVRAVEKMEQHETATTVEELVTWAKSDARRLGVNPEVFRRWPQMPAEVGVTAYGPAAEYEVGWASNHSGQSGAGTCPVLPHQFDLAASTYVCAPIKSENLSASFRSRLVQYLEQSGARLASPKHWLLVDRIPDTSLGASSFNELPLPLGMGSIPPI